MATDIKALDDLPDPEELVSGDLNTAYGLARRHLEPQGAMAEIGETRPYESMDVEELLDVDFDETTQDAIQTRSSQVCSDDERVSGAVVEASLSNDGELALSIKATGADGPFEFEVAAGDRLTVDIIRSA